MVEGCGRSRMMVAHAIVRPVKGDVPLRVDLRQSRLKKVLSSIASMEQLVEEPKTTTCVSSVTRKPGASLQDQSLVWDMVMKVGKNISMAEKERLYFGFVGVRGFFSLCSQGSMDTPLYHIGGLSGARRRLVREAD